jgi:hypothetical protein
MKIILKIISSIVVGSFITNLASGACTKPVTYVLENDKAQCDGFLYTKDYDSLVRFKLEERTAYEQLLDLERKRTSLLQDRLSLTQKNEEYLYEQVRIKEVEGFWARTVYFFGGVLITGVLATSLAKGLN